MYIFKLLNVIQNMDSDAALKLMKLFYETPRAQEIYKSLRQQREDVQRADNVERSFLNVHDRLVQDKFRNLSVKKEKIIPIIALPRKQNQESNEEFDKSWCSCGEQTMAETLSQCEDKLSQVFHNVRTYDSVLQEDQKQRELLNWSLKIVNDGEIIVEGQRSGDPPDISWRTSVIFDRMSTNVVRSKKGTLYFLLGEINEDDMIGKNFPQEIIGMFKYGFPSNWREIISKMSNQHERENKVHNKEKTPEITKDTTNAVVYEDTNVIHDMGDESSLQSDKSPSQSHPSRNTEGKYSSERKSPPPMSSATSQPPKSRTTETSLSLRRTSSSTPLTSRTTEPSSKLRRTSSSPPPKSRIVELSSKHRMTSLSSKSRTAELSPKLRSTSPPPNSRMTLSSPPNTRTAELSSKSRTTSPPPKSRITKSPPPKSRVTSPPPKSRMTSSSAPPPKSRITESSKPRTTSSLSSSKSRTRSSLSPPKSRMAKSSKPRTTSSSKPHTKNRTKKIIYSGTIEKNDAQEIEVQRSRSGRLIVPVLDYWRGQRICTSPGPEDGEITIIKSNLEEDSRLMLVETSKNSSGLLQNPTISSSTPTSATNKSDTDWAPSLTALEDNSNSTTSHRKKKSTTSLGTESQSEEATTTDSVGREKTKNFHRRKSGIEAKTIRTSRRTNEGDKIDKSETSSVEKSSLKSSKRTRSEKIANTRNSNTLKKKSEPNLSADGASDSNCDSEEQTKPNTKRRTKERKTSYPLRTRIQPGRQTNINEKSSSRMNPTTVMIDEPEENIVKNVKSTTSSRRSQNCETQHSVKSKVATGKFSSKTGSLARKRELREMLEQQDEGYEDDAFEGTPFRSKKVSKVMQHKVSPVIIADVSNVADGIEDENYKTPSGRTPMNRLRPAGPLSTGKSEIDMTPGLLSSVNRDNVDRYVNQLKRQKLRNLRKKVESHTPLTKKPSNTSMLENVDYSFDIQKSTETDNEENEDYYWSDNE